LIPSCLDSAVSGRDKGWSNAVRRDHYPVAHKFAVHTLQARLGEALDADLNAMGGYDQRRRSNVNTSHRSQQQNDPTYGWDNGIRASESLSLSHIFAELVFPGACRSESAKPVGPNQPSAF
jgi:hypothetical protein